MKPLYRRAAQFGTNVVIGLVLTTGTSCLLDAADLQAATLRAWRAYIRDADHHVQVRRDGQQPYLWADESPDRMRRIQHGEIAVAPMVGSGSRSVPDGLIHHWVGAIFIRRNQRERLVHK